MDGKKLNIKSEENDIGSSLDSNLKGNSWELLGELLENTLATRREINGLTNLIQLKDNHIKDIEDKLSEIEIKLSVYKERDNIFHEKIKDKDDLIAALSLDSTSIKGKLDNLMELISKDKLQVTENDAKIKEKDDQIAKLKSKINSYEKELEKSKLQIKSHETLIAKLNETTKKYAIKNENETLIHYSFGTPAKIVDEAGLVLYVPVQGDKIAGPGWIVIQNRTEGNVSFDKNLAAYEEGFGDPLGDFWLGLKRIHKITNEQQHELYIHMTDYEDKTHFARYDNFVVGSKDEKYTLNSLGLFKGNVWDMMRVSHKYKFFICKNYKNGWWYIEDSIGQCNLNGKLSDTQTNHSHNLYWGCGPGGKGYNSIKSVKMLIKPKNLVVDTKTT